ncbi:MAG TPA: trypsin-like peptidase domain-containing protein, partial [Methyloceanibacter sp.]|nr:trypsin-like peptidase domain-containing protein [Methyloceanibacter sp.]
MSITIKHLDGPLKGTPGEQRFDDTKHTILIGRAPECDVVYPEECIAVEGEHFTLNRDDEGNYRIGLPGSCDVEIDGRPAADGEKVTYGSVLRVGVDGPTFECRPSGLVIRHIEGPLAGTQQFFPANVQKITFGRPDEVTDVSYPGDYTKVGRFHFSLKQREPGNYYVELTPKHYVEINGEPAKSASPVKSGSKFRLSGPAGPSFELHIEQPAKQGIVTDENYEPLSEFSLIKWLSARTKQIGAAVGVLALLLGGAIGWVLYERQHYKWVEAHMLQSVYLVVDKSAGDAAVATAFYLGNGLFGTNAHVTEAIRGKAQAFYLLGPKGDKIAIKDVESHPGYALFKARALTYAKAGSTSLDDFQPMSLPSVYDVGIIRADPAQRPQSDPIEIDPAPKLHVGEDVITAGFPSENIRGADNVAKGLAAATFRKGTIESLKDIFFAKSSEDPDSLLLVQHGIPATGGMSGSPLVDAWTGKVVAVINGGNTMLLMATDAQEPAAAAATACPSQKGGQRITNPAQVNYAQRSDLLDDLIEGKAQAALAKDQAYWEAAGAKYGRYFDLALSAFLAGAGDASRQAAPEELGFVQGALIPGVKGSNAWAPSAAKSAVADEAVFSTGKSLKTASQSYSFAAEPGFEYGFIVDTPDALP